MTSWQSKPHICCRNCGFQEQTKDLLISLFAGWWGFPWGFIMTPIQIVRNIIELSSGPNDTKPSPKLYRIIQIHLRENLLRDRQATENSN
jgi:hypothetical protein